MQKDVYSQYMQRLLQEKKAEQKLEEIRKIGACCFCCGEDRPELLEIFELHHPFGKLNGNEKIPLCICCHRYVTIKQNLLPVKIKYGQTQEAKLRFMDYSMSVLLERYNEKRIQLLQKMM